VQRYASGSFHTAGFCTDNKWTTMSDAPRSAMAHLRSHYPALLEMIDTRYVLSTMGSLIYLEMRWM
jgi:hypothetical protein